jgi:hypothetical protein
LWDSILTPELVVLPVEYGRVDSLLDDPVFFAPFAAYIDAQIPPPVALSAAGCGSSGTRAESTSPSAELMTTTTTGAKDTGRSPCPMV